MLFNIDYGHEVLKYGFIGSGLIPPVSGNNPTTRYTSSPSLQQSVYISQRQELYRLVPQSDGGSSSIQTNGTNSHCKDSLPSIPMYNNSRCQREMYNTATVKDVVQRCIGNALVQSEWERLDIIYQHQLHVYEKHISALSPQNSSSPLSAVAQGDSLHNSTTSELPPKPQAPTRRDAICAVITAHRLGGKGSSNSSSSIHSCTTGGASRSPYPEPSSTPLDIGVLFLLPDVLGASRFEKEDILAALFEVRSVALVAIVEDEQRMGKRGRDEDSEIGDIHQQEQQVTIPVCVRRVQLSYAAVASLYARGQTNGIVIEAVPVCKACTDKQTRAVCGASSPTHMLHFTPVIGGIPVLHCCRDINMVYPEDETNHASDKRSGSSPVYHAVLWEWALHDTMMSFTRQVHSNTLHFLPSTNSSSTTKVIPTTSLTGNIGEIPMHSINPSDALQAAKSYLLGGDGFYKFVSDHTPPTEGQSYSSTSETTHMKTLLPNTNDLIELKQPLKSQVTRCISKAMENNKNDTNNSPLMGFGMSYCHYSCTVENGIVNKDETISSDDHNSSAAAPSEASGDTGDDHTTNVPAGKYPVGNDVIVEPLPLKSFLIRIKGFNQSAYNSIICCPSILQLARPLHHSYNELCAAWLGGTVLAQLPAFQSHFSVDRSAYKDEGPQQCVTNFPLDWR